MPFNTEIEVDELLLVLTEHTRSLLLFQANTVKKYSTQVAASSFWSPAVESGYENADGATATEESQIRRDGEMKQL